ncbi:HAD-IA family hydrolase [Paraburkholderia sp. JHI2823]|uniref:HAD-IA family hydrolase n=1 Tax=Paraburkholderia TaxID=1822464 RepID=UPI00040D517E|nr:HAD-IA family hydrolase [Paraburkholderia mimosarum]
MQVMSRKLPVDAVLFDLASILHGRSIAGHLTELFPAVEEALDGLRQMGLKLGVVTDKEAGLVEPLLQRFGLSVWFDIVVEGDALAQRKPQPAPLLHACEALAVAPAHALYVADSANDALAAQAAGMPMIRVSYGAGADQPISELPCLRVIDGPGELLDLIGSPHQRHQPERATHADATAWRHDGCAGTYV